MLVSISVAGFAFAASVRPSQDNTLPIYGVGQSGLAQAQAGSLAKAFGLSAVAADRDGAVRFNDDKAFLALPMKTLPASDTKDEDKGPFIYEGFDFGAIAKIQVIDTKKALARTEEGVRAVGGLPAGATPIASHTRFEATSKNGERLADQPIDTVVSYQFALGGVPLEGPGAKFRVAYDGSGRVIQLTYALRQLKPVGTVRIVDQAEAANRCATWTGDKATRKVTKASFAYYAAPLAERLERLEPSIRCESVDANGAVGQIYYVPAAAKAKRPQVVPLKQRPRVRNQHNSIGRTDVGSEGTGPCSGLPHTGTNVGTFNSRMTSGGVAVQFSWLDANAWEDDFKDPSKSGHDSDWVDDVDMVYWQGHGWPGGFSFAGCSAIDDDAMTNADALWGNRDLEWASLFTCLVLAEESGGQRWWQRWGPAFDRLHQINSFHTVSYHSASHGGVYANYLLRASPMKVRSAWAQASIDDQPAEVVWASMGVISAAGLVNYDDYFWGKGSVGPDIPAAQITGYWRLSGNS